MIKLTPPREPITERAAIDVLEEEKAEVVVLAAESSDDTPFTEEERRPTTWRLTMTEDSVLHAVNSTTGRTFNGSMAAFNALLRNK